MFKKRHKIRRKQVKVEEVLPPQIELEVPEAVPQPDLTHIPSSNILLVSNLPDNADEHLIEMYFESPKSGGCDGAVESIDFVEPKVVQITLINSEGKYMNSHIYIDLALPCKDYIDRYMYLVTCPLLLGGYKPVIILKINFMRMWPKMYTPLHASAS